MFIIGLDPSFTNAGIAVIDTEDKTVVFDSVGSPIGEKTFSNITKHIKKQTDAIMGKVLAYYGNDFVVITETPPASGYFSSGLFGLDCHLSIKLKEYSNRVFGVSPVYLAHIHGTRKYKKSDSVKLAKSFIEVFCKHDYSDVTWGRFSNDMAEAFIFAIRIFVSLYRNEVTADLLKICKALDDAKEFKL